jgi:hypothetical protein
LQADYNVLNPELATFKQQTAIFAAYAVSRYAFRGKRIFTTAVLSTQVFPGILFALPLFLIFVSIGNATGIPLYGSRGGLIISKDGTRLACLTSMSPCPTTSNGTTGTTRGPAWSTWTTRPSSG